MQCQLCDKHATVHLTEIVNNEKLERHLCEECAQKEGVTIKAHVPLNELLGNLMTSQQEVKELSELRCPHCHLSWAEFRKRGLLGCPNDYEVFEKPLEVLIERAHEGETVHVGKVPSHGGGELDNQVRLLRLRQDLQQAVEQEDYEAAAHIRDEIHNLER